MTQKDATFYLAMWASLVSTTLAIIKVIEYLRDRFYLDVYTEFAEESRIKIINPSKVAVQIIGFELFWAKKRTFIFFDKKPIRIDESEGYIRGNTLQPNSYAYLELQDPAVIPWGQRPEGTKLYLKVELAGKHKPNVLCLD